MLGLLVMLLVAGIVGFIGAALAPGSIPGGWIGAIIAGLFGSALGGYLFGLFGLPLGPEIGRMALIPSIIGAAIVVWLFSLVGRQTGWSRV